MVTIKMIAKECGFSIATVSKALNGAPDISKRDYPQSGFPNGLYTKFCRTDAENQPLV